MLRSTLLLACVAIAAANICTTNQGSWSYGIADGVTDFAHANVHLNKSFYCFEGCLYTGTVVQNYKVLLSGNKGNVSAIEREMTKEQKMMKIRDADPNADFCVDPAVRADVASALKKVTDHSAKGIAKALSYNLNRPGWCINVVKTDGFSLDSVFQDMNFCDYTAFVGGEIYDIRLAAIDFS